MLKVRSEAKRKEGVSLGTSHPCPTVISQSFYWFDGVDGRVGRREVWTFWTQLQEAGRVGSGS